jgi:hypothetical protein
MMACDETPDNHKMRKSSRRRSITRSTLIFALLLEDQK